MVLYNSDATSTISNALNGKFYVIRAVEMESPTLVYKNLGNVLLDQREKVLSWIASHANNAEAVARYQVQLELINEALVELGLVEADADLTTPGLQPMVKRELDILFIQLPNVYAAPGSVFIEANNTSLA
ncbi:hypothetical protein LP420_40290 [Massilia sp. B-10]|nr:hypothetical protein LP420_40290 [Massilia sp. B-10]